jgi:mycoredoxin
MKKLVLPIWFIAATIFIVGMTGKSGIFDTAPDFTSMHKEGIVLYATSWCPYCEKTRAFFRENNIPYFEYDIEKSKEGRRQFDILKGNGIPLVIAKGKIIRGFNTAAITNTLKDKS